LLITATGLTRSKAPQDFIFQILFLPVTAFFFYAFLREIKKPKTEKSRINKRFIFFALSVFLALLLVAFFNILPNQAQT